MNDRVVETERLYCRPWLPADIDEVAAIYANPIVMHYIPGGAWSREQVKRTIVRFEELCVASGISLYPVILRESGAIVGHAGHMLLKDTGEVEVDYLFDEPYWNRGFATEIARAMLAHGFITLKLERTVALAMPENTASINVMQKLGMQRDGFSHHFGHELVQYSMVRETFLTRDG